MDRRGVIGMPVRLMVALLIVAMCVPALSFAVGNFEEETDITEVKQEAGRMVSAASSVYYRGQGNSKVIDVKVKPGCELAIDPKENAYGINVVREGRVVDTIYSQRPPIKFIGDAVDVTGSATLRFTCEDNGGTYGVRVTPI